MRLQSPMQARNYALALSGIAVGLFLAVAIVNFVIDPTGVFGTNIVPQHAAFNDRYARFSEYQSHPDRFDAVLFGSSRSGLLPFNELSRDLGEATLANFGVTGGMLTDHLAVLEYMLHNPPTVGLRIRKIFLLLDVDSFGRRPFTNESLAFALPPAVTGESPVHFWWRNLIAIQPRFWRDGVKNLGQQRASQAPRRAVQQQRAAVSDMISIVSIAARAQGLPERRADEDKSSVPEKITMRPLYSQQLELWKRFVDLCRQHDIRLIVALSPLRRENESTFDRTDLAKLIDDIARVASVWDFTEAGWVADDRSLWMDGSHFTLEVGRMIVARVFGDRMPPRWADFGHFRPQQSIVMDSP